MYELVASAVNHPDRVKTLWAVFNQRSLQSLSRKQAEVTALVPRPRVPPVGPYSEFRLVPREDSRFPYRVAHPRFWYFLPKSLLYHRSGDSMAASLDSWLSRTSTQANMYHGCHLYPDGYALSSIGHATDTPLTAYVHGSIINKFDEFNGQTQSRILDTIQRAAHLFCSGYDIEAKIHDLDPQAETSVTPIGATPSNFPTEREAALRRELQVPADKQVVLYCGAYSKAKGVADLAAALERIDDDSIYFVGIGHGGELRDELRQAVSGSDPPHGRVLWQLHPVAVRRWFAVADLFVLPSYSEGRPTVIYEAMASETPVLATSVGGVPEQVEDGSTGWLFEPGDVSAIQNTIVGHDPDTLEEMGDAAKRRLEERGWTWDAHADRIINVHRQLLDQQ